MAFISSWKRAFKTLGNVIAEHLFTLRYLPAKCQAFWNGRGEEEENAFLQLNNLLLEQAKRISGRRDR